MSDAVLYFEVASDHVSILLMTMRILCAHSHANNNCFQTRSLGHTFVSPSAVLLAFSYTGLSGRGARSKSEHGCRSGIKPKGMYVCKSREDIVRPIPHRGGTPPIATRSAHINKKKLGLGLPRIAHNSFMLNTFKKRWFLTGSVLHVR